MHCPTCGAEDWVHIHINLKEQDSLRFSSCRACESRRWVYDGAQITLDQALELTAAKDPS